MGREIERKFRVKGTEWRIGQGIKYRQGYLSTVRERTVRVRRAGEKAYLTMKGVNVGAMRSEYEYEISVQDADEMLDQLCQRPLVEKRRYRVEYAGLTWEIDEFTGENEGLVVAEVELTSEELEVQQPPWVGQEVTGDPRYFNANLVAHPYRTWSDDTGEAGAATT
jgi:CYTH domain-containing protein